MCAQNDSYKIVEINSFQIHDQTSKIIQIFEKIINFMDMISNFDWL